MNEIIEYVQSKNIAFKQSGNEVILKCPTCGKEKLSININSGLYRCFVCEAKYPNSDYVSGHINKLKELWGDVIPIQSISERIDPEPVSDLDYSREVEIFHHNLLENKRALKYLLKRGFTKDTIEEYKLGYARKFNQDWIAIPSFENGVPKLLKYRKIPPDSNKSLAKYIREDGGKSVLFNGDILDKYDEIFLCLHEDSLIDVDNTFIKIKDISAGKVNTHKFNKKDIYNNINTDSYKSINIIKRHYSPFDVKVTPNHKLLAAKGRVCSYPSWKLKCKPSCPRWKKYSTLDCELPVINWIPADELQCDDFLIYPIDKTVKKYINNDFDSTSSYFWFLVGAFLGDGSVGTYINGKYYSVVFYININDHYLQNKIRECCSKLDLNLHEYKNRKSVLDMVICNTKLATFMNQFYNNNRDKFIPSDVMYLDPNLQKNIVEGLFYTDGYFHKSEDRITNTSIQLLLNIQKILLRNNIISSINLTKKAYKYISNINGKEILSKKDLYHLTGNFIRLNKKRSSNNGGFIYDNYLFSRIKSNVQEEFSGITYNLSVKDDHSYCGNLVCYKNCEGELDALTLIQNGYKNTVGITAGAGSLLPEWFDRLIMKEKIFLILDPDGAGQTSAKETWATRLGFDRCWNVRLPDKIEGQECDINLFFQYKTKDDFDKLVKSAYRFKVDGLVTLSDSLYNLYNYSKDENNIIKYELPWPSLNKLLNGGLKKTRLTVLGGIPGCITGDTKINIYTDDNISYVNSIETVYFNIIYYDNLYTLTYDGNDIIKHKIKNVYHSGKKEVYQITTLKGFTIKATEDHLFKTHKSINNPNSGFTALKDLQEGGFILVNDDGFVYLDIITDIRYKGKEDTYDIEMEDPYHNFLANNFIVHNSGKTTMALQILYYFAIKYDMPSLMFNMEMHETSLATKIVQLDNDLLEEEVDPSDALVYAMGLKDLPIYFGYSPKIKPDIFYNTMKIARDRYGVQIGVFDNLQRLVRTGEESDIARASGMFKDIAMDLHVMFILISQPRKRSENDNSIPTYDMLKGSSSIPADSDEVILLHRRRKPDCISILDPITKVIVDKARHGSGGMIKLNFLGEKSRFEELRQEI